ncbi:CLUMA_CG017336, isoform A [Clunio marinus]|uniref:CLUMA_CG017336, isoform A n=1 Tax=Clunio marinus TaxID=568069 RepID=A0A1J1J059_9DIPT|nr:CLUMA_CG017336, isoform A [Clunio marinus]
MENYKKRKIEVKWDKVHEFPALQFKIEVEQSLYCVCLPMKHNVDKNEKLCHYRRCLKKLRKLMRDWWQM